MSQKKKDNQRKSKKKLKITAILIGIVLFLDLTPLGGTMRFYATWMSCGRLPVQAAGPGYFNEGTAYYETAPKFNLFPGNREYFCTAFDAEKHGYSADSKVYRFPELKKNNALCQKPTDPESETAAIFSPCK